MSSTTLSNFNSPQSIPGTTPVEFGNNLIEQIGNDYNTLIDDKYAAATLERTDTIFQSKGYARNPHALTAAAMAASVLTETIEQPPGTSLTKLYAKFNNLETVAGISAGGTITATGAISTTSDISAGGSITASQGPINANAGITANGITMNGTITANSEIDAKAGVVVPNPGTPFSATNRGYVDLQISDTKTDLETQINGLNTANTDIQTQIDGLTNGVYYGNTINFYTTNVFASAPASLTNADLADFDLSEADITNLNEATILISQKETQTQTPNLNYNGVYKLIFTGSDGSRKVQSVSRDASFDGTPNTEIRPGLTFPIENTGQRIMYTGDEINSPDTIDSIDIKFVEIKTGSLKSITVPLTLNLSGSSETGFALGNATLLTIIENLYTRINMLQSHLVKLSENIQLVSNNNGTTIDVPTFKQQ